MKPKIFNLTFVNNACCCLGAIGFIYFFYGIGSYKYNASKHDIQDFCKGTNHTMTESGLIREGASDELSL